LDDKDNDEKRDVAIVDDDSDDDNENENDSYETSDISELSDANELALEENRVVEPFKQTLQLAENVLPISVLIKPDDGRSRASDHRSLFLFAPDSLFRRFCVYVTNRNWFRWLVLLLILANSALLAIYDPVDKDSVRNKVLDYGEYFFLAMFTVEMLLKMVAMGAVRYPGAYLRDPWNVLDFVVVVTGFISVGAGSGGASIVRALRVLRPLRLMTALPGMRRLVVALTESLPGLISVCLLLIFFVAIFAILGLELYMGRLRQHCENSLTDELVDVDQCCNPSPSWAGGLECERGETCEETDLNPFFGITSFDNIGASLLIIFQVLTLEGWSDVCYLTMNATVDFSVIYFVAIIALGTFIFLELFLSVLAERLFAHDDDGDEQQEQRNVADAHVLASNGSVGDSDSTQSLSSEKCIGAADDGMTVTEDSLKLPRTVHMTAAWVRSAVQRFRRADGAHPRLDAVARWTRDNVVERLWFRATVATFIVANGVTLAMTYAGQSDGYADALNICNLLFQVLFTVEMLIKWLALGIYGYFARGWNAFDSLIVAVGWVDLGVSLATGDGGSGLSALRVFRLARLLNLYPPTAKIVSALGLAGSLIVYYFMLFFLMVYVFAILGMQLFGGEFDGLGEDGGLPRQNYDTFWLGAFMTTFSLVPGENWTAVVYDTIRALSWPYVFYYLLLILIGGFVMLNLFLGILMDAFNALNEVEQQHDLEHIHHERSTIALGSNGGKDDDDDDDDDSNNDDEKKELNDDNFNILDEGASMVLGLPSMGIDFVRKVASDRVAHRERKRLKKNALHGNSCWLWQPDNRFRVWCSRVVRHRFYQWFILAVIIFSCVQLMLVNPSVDEDSSLGRFLFASDIFFVVVFGVEMLLKVIVDGFVLHRKSYSRNGWNVIDCAIVIAGVLSLSLAGANVSSVRAFRALRPVRLLTRYESMKVILHALWLTLPVLPNVIFISLFVWTVFAIVGLQLMYGRFSFCNDDSVPGHAECTGFYVDDEGAVRERQWLTPDTNFDDFFQSLFSVFKMAAGGDWPAIMYMAVDMTSIGEQPRRDASPAAALYFIFFLVCCTWLVSGLFIGTIIDNFNSIRLSMSSAHGARGSLFMTDAQREWVQMQRFLVRTRPIALRPPQPTSSAARRAAYRIAMHPLFDWAITVVIVANLLVMCLPHYDQSSQWDTALYALDCVFTGVYVAEAALKLAALLPRRYFASSWNRLDFFIVVVSIVGLAFPVGGVAKVFRVLRIARIFKVIKNAHRLRVLLKTLLISLPAVINILGLLVVVFFVYATLGVAFFADVDSGVAVDDRFANFATFGNAIFLLFRIATGEDWELIMEDVSSQYAWAPVYFVSFVIIGAFVMLNLFIAVIMENFSFISQLEDASDVTLADFQRFSRVWQHYDPERTRSISVNMLAAFLRRLEPPLGLGRDVDLGVAKQVAASLDVPLNSDGRVSFNDWLFILTSRVYGNRVDPIDIEHAVERHLNRSFKKKRLRVGEGNNERVFAVSQAVAVVKIQRAWRQHLRRRQERQERQEEEEVENQGQEEDDQRQDQVEDQRQGEDDQRQEEEDQRQEEDEVEREQLDEDNPFFDIDEPTSSSAYTSDDGNDDDDV
jgi:voltage-dependent calcium channel L type alpha-1D